MQTRTIDHLDGHVDTEQYFSGVWAVVKCNVELVTPYPMATGADIFRIYRQLHGDQPVFEIKEKTIMNNSKTEEALIIRTKLQAHGYKLYGLTEMNRVEQILLVRYLKNNEFNPEEMNGIAKLFESRLWKCEEEEVPS